MQCHGEQGGSHFLVQVFVVADCEVTRQNVQLYRQTHTHTHTHTQVTVCCSKPKLDRFLTAASGTEVQLHLVVFLKQMRQLPTSVCFKKSCGFMPRSNEYFTPSAVTDVVFCSCYYILFSAMVTSEVTVSPCVD